VVRLLPVAVLLAPSRCPRAVPRTPTTGDLRGEGAPARHEISYLSARQRPADVENNVTLPWQGGVVPSKPGRLRLDVTPAKGAGVLPHRVTRKGDGRQDRAVGSRDLRDGPAKLPEQR